MAKAKRFYTNRLGGGINTMAAPDAIPFFSGRDQQVEAQFTEMENWVPNTYGSATKATGFEVDHTSGVTSNITGLFRYLKENGNSYFIYTQGTGLYLRTGTATRTTISSALAVTATPQFTQANDVVIVCDGTSAPLVWNGTTVSALSSTLPAPGSPNVCIGAKGALYSQRRVWLWGQPGDPNVLFYSNENDHTQGYATQLVACNISDGEVITGVKELFLPATFETALVVFKSNKTIGIVKGDGSVGNPYTYSVTSRSGGTPGPNCSVQIGQNIIYLNQNGVGSLLTDIQNVNLGIADQSSLVKKSFTALDQVYLKNSIVLDQPKKSRVMFIVPENGQTVPNVIWHYHTKLQCWYKERWNNGQRATAAFVDNDGVLYHGDEAGLIHRHSEVFSFNGQPINAILTTPYLSFGDTRQRKQFGQASIAVAGFGASQLGITYRYDYGERVGMPQAIDINNTQYVWGGGTWNDDGSYLWGQSLIREPRFYPSGFFTDCQLSFTHNSTTGPIQFFDIGLDVKFTGAY